MVECAAAVFVFSLEHFFCIHDFFFFPGPQTWACLSRTCMPHNRQQDTLCILHIFYVCFLKLIINFVKHNNCFLLNLPIIIGSLALHVLADAPAIAWCVLVVSIDSGSLRVMAIICMMSKKRSI